jgi:hypothetical protein
MAKAYKKAKKRLEDRQKLYDAQRTSKDSTTRPGSMNRKKSHPVGDRRY